ncbi:MAG TPA: DUF2721 domain-containing protein [Nevskiaceae bacterium]|nr:DUF2721 domain-containing protein [Nevskiaceae bacterium]
MQPTEVVSIAHAIQLAVAPVFLLTAISGMLGVLTNRLSRLMDRARDLEGEFPEAAPVRLSALKQSLANLARRARLILRAITFCIACAMAVSSVVIALFIDTLTGVNLARPIAVLFMLGISLLFVALLCFLREIYLSTRYLRIGVPEPEKAPITPPPAA